MKSGLFAVAMLASATSGASAQEAAPMDLSAVDPALVADLYGPWRIRDRDGGKTCVVVLKPDETIGGSEIEVGDECAKAFPVMDEIAAWRLMENWRIDLVDATRHTRVTFFTPDEAYVAEPEVDGIATIEQLPK